MPTHQVSRTSDDYTLCGKDVRASGSISYTADPRQATCLRCNEERVRRCVRACEGLGDDPERAVRELVDTLRKAHAQTIRLQTVYHGARFQKVSGNSVREKLIPLGRIMNGVLERHGLLRAYDDPEQFPDAWKPRAIDHACDADEDSHYAFDERGSEPDPERNRSFCPLCGAGPYEACHPNCEDGR